MGARLTTEQFFTLRPILHKFRESNISTHYIFIDFKVAYDIVNREQLGHVRHENGFPSILFRLIKATMKKVKCIERGGTILTKAVQLLDFADDIDATLGPWWKRTPGLNWSVDDRSDDDYGRSTWEAETPNNIRISPSLVDGGEQEVVNKFSCTWDSWWPQNFCPVLFQANGK